MSKYDDYESKSDSLLTKLIASRWTAAIVGAAVVVLAVAFTKFGALFCS